MRDVRGVTFPWMGLPTQGHGDTGMRRRRESRGNGEKRLATALFSGHTECMSTLTIELPARRDQTEFDLQRWSELLTDTALGRQLAKIEGRIETDRHGYIIMSPPAGFSHGSYQSEIAVLLRSMLPKGRVVTECPISTADGVRAADVAWISKARLTTIGENVCLPMAPEICVEVISQDNTRAEMGEKKALLLQYRWRDVPHSLSLRLP